MSAATIATIVLAALGVLGLIGAGVRGLLRFAQYLVRAEEAADRVAVSNEHLSARLGEYMERNDKEIRNLDNRMVRVEDRLGVST